MVISKILFFFTVCMTLGGWFPYMISRDMFCGDLGMSGNAITVPKCQLPWFLLIELKKELGLVLFCYRSLAQAQGYIIIPSSRKQKLDGMVIHFHKNYARAMRCLHAL